MNRPADPGRRSLLLDARRWPFFGALFAPVNRDNLHLREPSATHNSPKDVRDVEKAGSGHDLPPESGGTGDSKGKSGTSNPPPASVSDDADENSELLSVWQQRLQSITLVTSFLASMDGSLFSLTALSTDISQPAGKTSRELIYSCLAGALIFHVSAAILGYVATFALIRYRLVDVSLEEDIKLEGVLGSPSDLSTTPPAPPAQRVPRKIVLEPIHPAHYVATFLQRSSSGDSNSGSSRSPLPLPPPLSLLTRCYYTTLCLTSVGFILALTGILTYAWVGLQMYVGIFSTACLGIAVGAGIWAVFI